MYPFGNNSTLSFATGSLAQALSVLGRRMSDLVLGTGVVLVGLNAQPKADEPFLVNGIPKKGLKRHSHNRVHGIPLPLPSSF